MRRHFLCTGTNSIVNSLLVPRLYLDQQRELRTVVQLVDLRMEENRLLQSLRSKLQVASLFHPNVC